MTTDDDIQQQQELLAAHRRILTVYLQRLAPGGAAQARTLGPGAYKASL